MYLKSLKKKKLKTFLKNQLFIALIFLSISWSIHTEIISQYALKKDAHIWVLQPSKKIPEKVKEYCIYPWRQN